MTSQEQKFEKERGRPVCSCPTKEKGRPVCSFPMEYEWHAGYLKKLFSKQVRFLKDQIKNARSDDRSVIYLSCPISARGGGFTDTNLDIAKFTQRKIMDRFGDRVWVLNPAAYQMESKSGRGYFQQHAEKCNIPSEEIDKLPPPIGGDYMRMWTKVLVEDDDKNLGEDFDAYYFLSPEDVAGFYQQYGGITLSSQIETYIGNKLATCEDFKKEFEGNYMGSNIKGPICEVVSNKDDIPWEQKVKNFIRFYALRAGANFSKGCHDEWNIFRIVNEQRYKATHDVGCLLAGFFNGRQLDPAGSIRPVVEGYEIKQ